MIAEAVDLGMAPEDWCLTTNPKTPPSAKAVLMHLWITEVLAKFAALFGLSQLQVTCTWRPRCW